MVVAKKNIIYKKFHHYFFSSTQINIFSLNVKVNILTSSKTECFDINLFCISNETVIIFFKFIFTFK